MINSQVPLPHPYKHKATSPPPNRGNNRTNSSKWTLDQWGKRRVKTSSVSWPKRLWTLNRSVTLLYKIRIKPRTNRTPKSSQWANNSKTSRTLWSHPSQSTQPKPTASSWMSSMIPPSLSSSINQSKSNRSLLSRQDKSPRTTSKNHNKIAGSSLKHLPITLTVNQTWRREVVQAQIILMPMWYPTHCSIEMRLWYMLVLEYIWEMMWVFVYSK